MAKVCFGFFILVLTKFFRILNNFYQSKTHILISIKSQMVNRANKYFWLFSILVLIGWRTASGLKMQKQPENLLLLPNAYKNQQHKLYHDPKSQSHDIEIPVTVFNNLKEFVADDQLIMNRIHAEKPLSKASANKIKSYFLQNQEFREFTLKNFVSSSKNPNCLEGIKQQSRERLFKIIMDQLDFRTIFLTEKPEEEFTQDEINAIVLELKTDKQLRPYLENCFGRNSS